MREGELEDGTGTLAGLTERIYARNVELEKENKVLREELNLLKLTPTDVKPFEPKRTTRVPWQEVRKKIEAAAQARKDELEKKRNAPASGGN